MGAVVGYVCVFKYVCTCTRVRLDVQVPIKEGFRQCFVGVPPVILYNRRCQPGTFRVLKLWPPLPFLTRNIITSWYRRLQKGNEWLEEIFFLLSGDRIRLFHGPTLKYRIENKKSTNEGSIENEYCLLRPESKRKIT